MTPILCGNRRRSGPARPALQGAPYVNGGTLTVNWSVAVAYNGALSVQDGGGGMLASATYLSGTNTTQIVYTLDNPVSSGDVVFLAGAASSVLATVGGAGNAAFSGVAVTNATPAPDHTPTAFTSVQSGNASDPATWHAAAMTNIIDDVDAGYSDAGGGWASYPLDGSYGTHIRYTAAAGTGTNSASWHWTGLTPAAAKLVGLTWPPYSTLGDNVPWAVLDSDGVTVLASGTVNMQLPSGGGLAGGFGFQILGGSLAPSGTSLTLRITDNCNGKVFADAAALGTPSATTTVPNVPGDTIEVARGHAVALGFGVTLGQSGAPGTDVLTVREDATLNVGAGVTVRLRGDARLAANGASGDLRAGGIAHFAAGSRLVFDSSVSAASYVFYIDNQQYASAPAKLFFDGTHGAPIGVTSVGANGRFGGQSGTGDGYGSVAMDWVEASDLGAAGTAAITMHLVPSATHVRNTVFRRCGLLSVSMSNATFTLSGNTFVGSLGASSFGDGSATLAAAPVYTGNRFDKTVGLVFLSATVEDNVFLGGYSGGANADALGTFKRNVVRYKFDSNLTRYGSWDESLISNDASTLDLSDGTYSATAIGHNPHWLVPMATGAGVYCEIGHCVIEDLGSEDDGDVDYGPNGPGLKTYMHHCIGISQIGDNPGTMATFNGSATSGSKYEHNTWMSGQQGAMALAEAGNGYVGMLESYKSNVLWRRTGAGAGGYKVHSYNLVGNVTDMGAAANLDYNAVYLVSGTGGVGTNGYNLPLTGTPGVHDYVFSADPFVDSSRNFSTWVASIESTWAGNASPSRTDYNARGWWKLFLSNLTTDPNYDSRYTLAAYLTYIRAGYALVTPGSYPGHDATAVGAVP